MERVDSSNEWPITYDQALEAKETLKAALVQHPELRCGLGVYVVDQRYKVAIRLRDEGQEALAAELAERYIPGIPVDIEHSGAIVARALQQAESGQIIPRPDRSRLESSRTSTVIEAYARSSMGRGELLTWQYDEQAQAVTLYIPDDTDATYPDEIDGVSTNIVKLPRPIPFGGPESV